MADYIRATDPRSACSVFSQADFSTDTAKQAWNLAIALGGDGSMLHMAHVCVSSGTPILGVNLGRLGFLAELGRSDWQDGINHILKGDYWIERRMMLHVELLRAGQTVGAWEALNECAVTRGSGMRMVHLEAEIDDQPLTTYAADGLIAATATGSTAYALAAGGPILPPELRNILLVPVAPHLSVERAVVLPEGAKVTIRVHTEANVVLSCDGQYPHDVLNGDCVQARASEFSAGFVRVQGQGYFYRNITTRLNRNPQTGSLP